MTYTDTPKPILPVLLQALRLPYMKRQWQELESLAIREGWSHAQFLLALCEGERDGRYASRVERYLKDSGLPRSKSLSNFDFSCCPTVDQGTILRLASDPFWLDRGENLLIFGPSGVGKTHIAAAIARSLIESGRRIKFTTATVLVQQLQQAKAELVLPTFLSKLERYELLVIDDLGYVKKSEAETSVLFELISHRYELKSLLITANQTFSEWDSIFADATMTVAAVDRLVHHATIIEISQESFRKKTALSRSNFRDSNQPL
ncbi:MAG: ATP-binding protein [Hydrococcus sp. RM1_1_31]|nr:ATP-binding protein [Hydrococcus sp. RM1_1_31]